MPTRLVLPPFVSSRSVEAVALFCQRARDAEDDVEVDARRLKFVDPLGMAMLGASFFSLRESGTAVSVRGLPAEVGGYLQRMDVFEGVSLVGCAPQPGRRRNRADALLELTRLERTANAGNVAHRIANALVGAFRDVDPDEPPDEMTGYTRFERLMEPLQYALSELLENALTHARRHGHTTANVWVASQYYPSNGLVRLGVVDNGCGFLASLRGHPELHRETHLDAILTGLHPRVSCNRDLGIRGDSVNQGVGLTTVSRIAARAAGSLVIVSGDGLHDTAGRSRRMGQPSYWQGVGIAMECRRNALNCVNFRELLPSLEGAPPVPLRFE
jgi:hypothetical protein